ncbi:hypothetical protein MMC13_000834 [Lambiella insularis]|nr:hypothetical protein [Lambiella insularis]
MSKYPWTTDGALHAIVLKQYGNLSSQGIADRLNTYFPTATAKSVKTVHHHLALWSGTLAPAEMAKRKTAPGVSELWIHVQNFGAMSPLVTCILHVHDIIGDEECGRRIHAASQNANEDLEDEAGESQDAGSETEIDTDDAAEDTEAEVEWSQPMN